MEFEITALAGEAGPELAARQVAAMTLLADSRCGRAGGLPPWVLLAIGSAASLAANVAVAEPTLYGRLIAAWPSFALIGAYEMLMRQIRQVAANRSTAPAAAVTAQSAGTQAVARSIAPPRRGRRR